MMQFGQFPYQRPDLDGVKQEFTQLISGLTRAAGPDGVHEFLLEINRLRQDFESMSSLARIRHTLDTRDAYYKAEQDFFDEAEPLYQQLVNEYYRALVASPLRTALSAKWGKQLFTIAEMTLQTSSPAVIEDLQQENRLGSRYKQLLASASIPFDGEERNLAQLVPFQESRDRQIRKGAHEARYSFFSDHCSEFDQLFDELVQIRTTIARKLGFASFTDLGYLRMKRSDYDQNMVAVFRRQIEQYVVPQVLRLREKQRRRLGLESLLYYDEKFLFADGNARPEGSAQDILDGGRAMYGELSAETGRFFEEMRERALFDLESRKGKAAGGYCDYLAKFRAPYIFANFNGTSGDIDVLTHEAGHAFQVWLCRDCNVPEYYFATMDAAEIPSMGMEVLTWPWMERFFGSQADKYRFAHLSDALVFLPYGTLVDEFQHAVYAAPAMKPQERRHTWRMLEKKYLPHRDYADNRFLEDGGFWFQQGHIFEAPFYYIDYVLAQSCVFQLWQRANTDRAAAWADYLALCKKGGSLPFTELLRTSRLSSPFEAGSLAHVAEAVGKWLDNVNDANL